MIINNRYRLARGGEVGVLNDFMLSRSEQKKLKITFLHPASTNDQFKTEFLDFEMKYCAIFQ